MKLPEMVYLQTLTACNGHCRYCPFDDIYGGSEPYEMSFDVYSAVLDWLHKNNYKGRLGYLLHYEPTLDDRLPEWVEYARDMLPGVRIETATNGIIKPDFLRSFDVVDEVPVGLKKVCNSRAGNVRACAEIENRERLSPSPCKIPEATMCISAGGDVLLCCQDWRHEAVVGTVDDLTAARARQMSVNTDKYEFCLDCMAGKTAEEVGERLGKRLVL